MLSPPDGTPDREGYSRPIGSGSADLGYLQSSVVMEIGLLPLTTR
jgi:hypothetical protein